MIPAGVQEVIKVPGTTTNAYSTPAATTPLWADRSVMGCADCHTSDGGNQPANLDVPAGTYGNAHGSSSEYLLKDVAGGAAEGSYTGLNYVCYRCHKADLVRRRQSHTQRIGLGGRQHALQRHEPRRQRLLGGREGQQLDGQRLPDVPLRLRVDRGVPRRQLQGVRVNPRKQRERPDELGEQGGGLRGELQRDDVPPGLPVHERREHAVLQPAGLERRPAVLRHPRREDVRRVGRLLAARRHRDGPRPAAPETAAVLSQRPGSLPSRAAGEGTAAGRRRAARRSPALAYRSPAGSRRIVRQRRRPPLFRRTLQAALVALLAAAAVDFTGFKLGAWRPTPALFAALMGASALLAVVEAGLVVRELWRGPRGVARAGKLAALLGLLLMAGGGLVNWMSSLRGYTVLLEGEKVPLAGGRNVRGLEVGLLAATGELDATLGLLSVDLQDAPGGFYPEAVVLATRPGRERERLVVLQDVPAALGSLRLFLGAFGFAPRIVVLKGDETLLDDTVLFTTRRDGESRGGVRGRDGGRGHRAPGAGRGGVEERHRRREGPPVAPNLPPARRGGDRRRRRAARPLREREGRIPGGHRRDEEVGGAGHLPAEPPGRRLGGHRALRGGAPRLGARRLEAAVRSAAATLALGLVLLGVAALGARRGEAAARPTAAEVEGAVAAVRELVTIGNHLAKSGGDTRFAERIPAAPAVVEEILADVAFTRHAGRIEEHQAVQLQVEAVERAEPDGIDVVTKEYWVVRSSPLEGMVVPPGSARGRGPGALPRRARGVALAGRVVGRRGSHRGAPPAGAAECAGSSTSSSRSGSPRGSSSCSRRSCS